VTDELPEGHEATAHHAITGNRFALAVKDALKLAEASAPLVIPTLAASFPDGVDHVAPGTLDGTEGLFVIVAEGVSFISKAGDAALDVAALPPLPHGRLTTTYTRLENDGRVVPSVSYRHEGGTITLDANQHRSAVTLSAVLQTSRR